MDKVIASGSLAILTVKTLTPQLTIGLGLYCVLGAEFPLIATILYILESNVAPRTG